VNAENLRLAVFTSSTLPARVWSSFAPYWGKPVPGFRRTFPFFMARARPSPIAQVNSGIPALSCCLMQASTTNVVRDDVTGFLFVLGSCNVYLSWGAASPPESAFGDFSSRSLFTCDITILSPPRRVSRKFCSWFCILLMIPSQLGFLSFSHPRGRVAPRTFVFSHPPAEEAALFELCPGNLQNPLLPPPCFFFRARK